MKVLHILNELRFSGAETMLECAGSFFQDQGLDSHILGTTDQLGDFGPNLDQAGYTIHHIPLLKWGRFTSPRSYLSFYHFFKKKQFDAIHIHPERANVTYALLAKFAGCKCIVRTVHHIFPPPQNIKGFFRKWLTHFQRWFAKRILGVVFVSNSRSGLANERNAYRSENLLVPNWFDSRRFQPDASINQLELRERLSLRQNAFLIVSLGGNWPYKNYHLVVEALKLIPPEIDVLYVQVGPNGKGIDLIKHAETFGVSHRVRCAGKVSDPLHYLYAADVYVMPSSIEGFGCAAAEAMGAGLPTILAYTPALKDFEVDCTQITYVEPSAESLADALIRIEAMDKQERQTMGQQLSQEVHVNYGIENGAAKYVELYQGARALD
jgi:glycosyltransferase involved in cell wall biosynthesis